MNATGRIDLGKLAELKTKQGRLLRELSISLKPRGENNEPNQLDTRRCLFAVHGRVRAHAQAAR